ncbi:hypothetical protein Y032_0562g3486 [Ancylostoma ceylanicum]|uniref:ER membrane protein complex subunit 6 n=1 Tax=Ancylostoma ceylanicum TaxID=53326 RepID=A0A016WPN0_9BILA|nr:hypothetical protein Y032_0562g3486 [Ancylostoma ceylanicum]
MQLSQRTKWCSPRRMAPKTKASDKNKDKQKGLEVFSESAMRNNFSSLEYSRTCQAAASGMAAGILGLTGIPGFIFYFVTVAIQVGILLLSASTILTPKF